MLFDFVGYLVILEFVQENPTEIFCDNKSTIAIANLVQHSPIKHIKIKYHVLREVKEEGVNSFSLEKQLMDILTKALSYN